MTSNSKQPVGTWPRILCRVWTFGSELTVVTSEAEPQPNLPRVAYRVDLREQRTLRSAVSVGRRFSWIEVSRGSRSLKIAIGLLCAHAVLFASIANAQDVLNRM